MVPAAVAAAAAAMSLVSLPRRGAGGGGRFLEAMRNGDDGAPGLQSRRRSSLFKYVEEGPTRHQIPINHAWEAECFLTKYLPLFDVGEPEEHSSLFLSCFFQATPPSPTSNVMTLLRLLGGALLFRLRSSS